MNKRILQIIDKYDGYERGNISKFGRKIGEQLDKEVKPSQISEWIAGKTKPGADYRRAICEAYGINRDWLDTGDGPMLREDAQDKGKTSGGTETALGQQPQSQSLTELQAKVHVSERKNRGADGRDGGKSKNPHSVKSRGMWLESICQ